MRIVPLLPFVCLAACNGGDGAASNAMVDVDAAASRAQHDIANYAAGTPSPSPTTSPTRPPELVSATPTPTPTSIAGITPSTTSAPTMTAPASQATPAAAEDVVRAYATALSQRRFRVAWRLWDGMGTASGMSAEAFVASFAKYADITGEVGRPYDGDAGAGNLFVTVPLTLRGTLKNGEPFVLRGPIVLHRVNDGIETPDPVDHLWRIKSSGLKPRPIAPQDAMLDRQGRP